MSYSVAQNTSFLTSVSICKDHFFCLLYFNRPPHWGREHRAVFFAITFTTIFTVVADFGLGPVLTREAARYPENSGKYINTIFGPKFCLA